MKPQVILTTLPKKILHIGLVASMATLMSTAYGVESETAPAATCTGGQQQ